MKFDVQQKHHNFKKHKPKHCEVLLITQKHQHPLQQHAGIFVSDTQEHVLLLQIILFWVHIQSKKHIQSLDQKDYSLVFSFPGCMMFITTR